ncbi:hypothetical protein SISSUDRAFT_1030052 [Sistotremastrum suecicum HHB10207 ss-3]|uniref:Uncharacterized protein n=1 Tax=Sistotremastrum suecicum HHB10207 ss-3 TaxID=1314776 RepID=A0A166HYL1_9AGAM|nr:hypothetical protein SISSUDRAFT_1030052 [Sistotremastrum suecicum HHB10207 ss-3]
MGSSQSLLSAEGITSVAVVVGAVTLYALSSSRAPSTSTAATNPKPAQKSKKSKKSSSASASSSVANLKTETSGIPGGSDVLEKEAALGVSGTAPTVLAIPEIAASAAKPKKKKSKKAPSSANASSTPALSESDAPTPEASGVLPAAGPSKSSKASAKKAAKQSSLAQSLKPDDDDAWTRVDRRKPSNIVTQAKTAGSESANVVTENETTATTTASSPTRETSSIADDDFAKGSEQPAVKQKTLAEKLAPKVRKTAVDDMLETPNQPQLARVIRVKPGPDEKPIAGYSWDDYEDVANSSSRLGGTLSSASYGADATTDDDEGWGVVRRNASETLTKKQRQNQAKREVEKEAKAAAEKERLERLAAHRRELEKVKIAEQYKSKPKQKGGGMTASVDESGKLVWE